MGGPASKPQGKGKGTGAEAAVDNGQLRQGACNAVTNEAAIHAMQLRALASAGPSQPSTKASPKPEITAKAPALSHSNLWTGDGSAWAWGHLRLSGSSDSWGGRGSHSPGSGSPRWCLRGPRGWGREGQGREDSAPHPDIPSHPNPAHTPLQAVARAGRPASQLALSLAT